MADSKIEVTIGAVSFAAEGEQQWVTAQLDKVLEQARSIPTAAAPARSGGPAAAATGTPAAVGTLASAVTSGGGTANQVRRFLATAVWLHDKGASRLTTAAVASALKANNQKKLGNPADCLGQLVGKGHAERDGKEFFVTDDGRAALLSGSSA